MVSFPLFLTSSPLTGSPSLVPSSTLAFSTWNSISMAVKKPLMSWWSIFNASFSRTTAVIVHPVMPVQVSADSPSSIKTQREHRSAPPLATMRVSIPRSVRLHSEDWLRPNPGHFSALRRTFATRICTVLTVLHVMFFAFLSACLTELR